jgi:hypothetical protein
MYWKTSKEAKSLRNIVRLKRESQENGGNLKEWWDPGCARADAEEESLHWYSAGGKGTILAGWIAQVGLEFHPLGNLAAANAMGSSRNSGGYGTAWRCHQGLRYRREFVAGL